MNTKPLALVTGAASGIGLEVSRKLLDRGWDLIAVVRSQASGDALRANLASSTPGELIETIPVDLSERTQVSALADQISGLDRRLTALINNAGVLGERPEFNSDGIELHMAVNVVAPFLLGRALTGRMAAPSAVVNVSSGSALRAGVLQLDELLKPTRFRKLFGSYAQSKLALSLMTRDTAPDLVARGICQISVDPGPNRTRMTAGPGMPALMIPVRNMLFSAPVVGAARVVSGLEAALAGRVAPGAFLTRDQVRPLPIEAVAGRELLIRLEAMVPS